MEFFLKFLVIKESWKTPQCMSVLSAHHMYMSVWWTEIPPERSRGTGAKILRNRNVLPCKILTIVTSTEIYRIIRVIARILFCMSCKCLHCHEQAKKNSSPKNEKITPWIFIYPEAGLRLSQFWGNFHFWVNCSF